MPDTLHRNFADRYWTFNIRLIALPYMASSLSNMVVPKLFGGRKREWLKVLFLVFPVVFSAGMLGDTSSVSEDDESATDD